MVDELHWSSYGLVPIWIMSWTLCIRLTCLQKLFANLSTGRIGMRPFSLLHCVYVFDEVWAKQCRNFSSSYLVINLHPSSSICLLSYVSPMSVREQENIHFCLLHKITFTRLRGSVNSVKLIDIIVRNWNAANCCNSDHDNISDCKTQNSHSPSLCNGY